MGPFQSWLEEHGVDLSKVSCLSQLGSHTRGQTRAENAVLVMKAVHLSPQVEVAEFPEVEYGLRAKRDLQVLLW